MKSKQINFFLTPEDVEEVNLYLKDKNLLVSPQPLPVKTVTLVDSLLVRNLDNDFQVRGQKYIFRAEDKQHVKVEYIAQQDYYSIEMTNSPVIEFLYPSHKPNFIRPGRIYFVKNTLNQDTNQEETKNESFLQAAEDLFQWFRKSFKNTKPPGYEGYLVSQRAWEWKNATGGELVVE